MPKNNSAVRRKERREEAEARNERNAGNVINCVCGSRHHKAWTGCAAKNWSK